MRSEGRPPRFQQKRFDCQVDATEALVGTRALRLVLNTRRVLRSAHFLLESHDRRNGFPALIANVTFEGLEISGRTITSAEEADMYLNHVKHLRFRFRPGAGQPTVHDDDSR